MKSFKNTQHSTRIVSSPIHKGLTSSSHHLLNKNSKFHPSFLKLTQKQLQEVKKYSKLQEEKNIHEIKEKSNDLIKKLIFENQQLNRKIKQSERKNKTLELINQLLQQEYVKIRSQFVILCGKIQQKQSKCKKNVEQKLNELKSSEAEVLSLFLRALQNENQQKNANNGILKQDRRFDTISKSLKTNNLQNVQITEDGFVVTEPFCKKVFAYKKSVSITAETEEAETQTQENILNDLLNDSKTTNFEQRQAELMTKLKDYESVIKNLEKMYGDIKGKYERVKSIIGKGKDY